MSDLVKHRDRCYKQMAMEVAVRNPERYPAMLAVFSKYEGEVLDDEKILEIYADMFREHVIDSAKIDADTITYEQIKSFIKDNLTHQNEWGFPTGYQASFTRYLKTLSELGFVFMQYKRTIRISQVADALISGELDVSEAFGLQCMRFWRKSPYRRVLNDFNYFSFVLKVIQKLEGSGRKLSYPQFILSLFSDNGDVDEFINLISSTKFGSSNEEMYDFIVSKYDRKDALHSKVVQFSSVFNDYGNTVLRVLRLTGFVSVENKSGLLLISINKDKEALLNYLIGSNFTVSTEAQESEEKYFEELGVLPDSLKTAVISFSESEEVSINRSSSLLGDIIASYNLDVALIEQLIHSLVSSRKASKAKNPFWYMDDPLQLEFFITLLLYMEYGQEYDVKPNYKADDKGVPYQHATGNIGDIYVTNKDITWLVEVTLIRSKDQQLNSETTSCVRHLLSNKNIKNYLSFVAPVVHQDTEDYYSTELLKIIMREKTDSRYAKNKYYMKPYDVLTFINLTISKVNFRDMEDYRTRIFSIAAKAFVMDDE